MASTKEIQQSLLNLKNRDRSYMQPRPYTDFLPAALPNVPERGISPQLSQAQIGLATQRSQKANELAAVKNYNDKARLEAARQKSLLAIAQKNLKLAQVKQPVKLNKKGQVINLSSLITMPAGSFGKVNPNAKLGTYNWNGFTLRLNKSVAPRFIGFLNALAATGYDVNTIGSYANRNIAGTSTKSLHSYGLAIDVNPANNPVTWNGRNITNLPRNIGRLAARYGLVWGGQWNGSKRDTMHFSVPAYGVK